MRFADCACLTGHFSSKAASRNLGCRGGASTLIQGGMDAPIGDRREPGSALRCEDAHELSGFLRLVSAGEGRSVSGNGEKVAGFIALGEGQSYTASNGRRGMLGTVRF